MRKPNLSIAIAGSSGFLGRALVRTLTQRGCQVKRLIRTQPKKDTSQEVYWNPDSGHIERVGLEGVDVVINLAGAGIADKRWSPHQKEILIHSRVQSTLLLAKTLAKLKTPPAVFLSASAIGYYGSSTTAQFDESSPKGEGFLADLCEEWEKATGEAEKRGIRVVYLRTAPVLDFTGGMLSKILPYFKLGLGAVIGSGEQKISWISLEDWIAACEFLIFSSDLKGPVNLSSPNPVSNREFGETLASVLHRPFKLHVPESFVRWRYGEMGQATLLEGADVQPAKLLKAGFEFEYPKLLSFLKAGPTS